MLLAAIALMAHQQFATTVRQELETIRTKYGLPSICAGAILNGKTVAIDAVGVRRMGSDEAVTINDRYHWGSNTKSFTAALVGVVVQQGKIKWDTTLADIFPDFVDQMKPAFRTVTPMELMSHRSGLNGETYSPGMPDWRKSKKNLPAQRLEYTKRALAEAPVAEPGSKYVYANRGFIVLGAALERVSNKPWEVLMRDELFKPLDMTTAGFGAAGWDTHTSEPWGHVMENGKLVPVPPGPGGDNLPILGPAGTLHASVPDMLKWCWFQAREGRDGGILEPSTFKVLHTAPFGGDYGGGFIIVHRDWAGGDALTHNGSNTMNYALLWIAPRRNFALAIGMNAMTPDAPKAADAIATMLIQRYCPQPSAN